MELHAVFQDASKTKLAVIGMIYQLGRHNAFVQKLIDVGLPEESNVEDPVEGEHIDLADALTSTSRYYTYDGSLTTPPCSEIVTWIVLQQQATMSKAQYEAFNDIMGNNFRPLQERNGRKVRVTSSRKHHYTESRW
jgi:carbonic anhydrase